KLAGGLFSQALDRDKPLWEMWLVEGLGESRFAIVSKTHHCMLDGISGVDLATVLMDRKPESAPPPKPPSWQPRKAPRPAALLFSSVKEQLSSPLRMAREALEPNSEAAKLGARRRGGGRSARARPGQHALPQGAGNLRQPGIRSLLPVATDRGEPDRASEEGARGDDEREEERLGRRRPRAFAVGRLRSSAADRAGGAAAGRHADVQPGGHERSRAAVPPLSARAADAALL